MTMTRFLWTTLAALGGVAAVIGFRATAQDANTPSGASTVIEAREDGTVVERTEDGKVLRMQKGLPHPPGFTGVRTADGRVFYGFQGGPGTLDEESKKLLEQEQALAQSVRTLASGAIGPDAEVKVRLRENLAKIFDLQQQRRTHEIAKIEERLGKLKETLKKREAVKDSIVDRRLETITGGVDELGWEETFPGGPGGPNAFIPTLLPGPVAVPPKAGPYGQPGATPVPPPVAPRAELPPTVPGPGAGLPPAAAPVPPLAPSR
jgi:hypothetical protein